MDGWVCLHRKILENPVVCKDSDYLAIWIYLLLNATHKEIEVVFKRKKIILKKGELITGRKKIAKQLKISESKTYRILKEFKAEQQIAMKSSSQSTLISILKWDKYQNNEQFNEQQNEQQMNNEWTTNEQRVNTNNNDNNETIYINNNIYNTEEKIEKKFEPSEAIKKAKALFAKNR